MTEATIDTPAKDHTTLPPGDYCIVELFGHTTMVGRYAEVERFGAKMMALEPLFNNTMLPAIFHGGSAIYRLTPCSAKVAWDRQPKNTYQIPQSLAATIPEALLNGPTDVGSRYEEDSRDDEADPDYH